MLEIQLLQLLLTFGGVGGVAGFILLILFFGRKIWSSFSKEYLEATKTATEITLYQSLSADIQRLRKELDSIRAEHRKEIELHKQEIEAIRIASHNEKIVLNEKIDKLLVSVKWYKDKNDQMRQDALDTYALMTTDERYSGSEFDEIKNRLMKIIIETNKEHTDGHRIIDILGD